MTTLGCPRNTFALQCNTLLSNAVPLPFCSLLRATPQFPCVSNRRFSVATPSNSLPFQCIAPRHVAFPLQGRAFQRRSRAIQNGALPLLPTSQLRLYITGHFFSTPLQTLSGRCTSITTRRQATHFLCHALPYSAFPLLGEAGLGIAAAILFNSLLFLCFAEIRIAPQSLRCSSRPKTELSRAYAVLGRAALRLSAAMPGRTPLFLCCARRNPAELSFAFAHPIDAMPCHCEAHQITANPFHCPVRRAYQPAFSSGKKFASCIM